jgi:hypothetical protein
MTFLRSAILAVVLTVGLAEAAHAQSSAPPCGWRGGSLEDPAATQRCLANRYKPPKPKAPAAAPQTPTTPPPDAHPEN